RTRDWRKQMPAEACQQFEAAAGDLLAQLGYPRAWPRISPDVEKQVDEIRLRFCAEASGRGDRLPGLPSGPAWKKTYAGIEQFERRPPDPAESGFLYRRSSGLRNDRIAPTPGCATWIGGRS